MVNHTKLQVQVNAPPDIRSKTRGLVSPSGRPKKYLGSVTRPHLGKSALTNLVYELPMTSNFDFRSTSNHTLIVSEPGSYK